MLRALVLGTALLLASAGSARAQLQKVNCQTQGEPFYLHQNSKVTHESVMDENGCRYSYISAQSDGRPRVFEKAVIAQAPKKGQLSQPGEFSFFYKPGNGFKGKDTFAVYICGTTMHGSGCSRITYNVTVR